MKTERDKMLAGGLYDAFDPGLVAERNRARDLCQALNATRDMEQEAQSASEDLRKRCRDRLCSAAVLL